MKYEWLAIATMCIHGIHSYTYSISNCNIHLLWIWILVDEKYHWLQYQHSVLLWGQRVDSIGTKTSTTADHFHCCFIKQCEKLVSYIWVFYYAHCLLKDQLWLSKTSMVWMHLQFWSFNGKSVWQVQIY